MSHIDIHQRSAGEKVVRFSGNNGDLVLTEFADKPGRSDTADPVAEDDYFHKGLQVLMIEPR